MITPDFICFRCGQINPDDEHFIQCLTNADLNAFVEEERLGLHGPDENAPLTQEEQDFVDGKGQD